MVGGIIGIIIGILWTGFKRDGDQYKLFGFTLKSNNHPSIKEVVPFKKKKVIDECDLCHGEDLYLNKSIMMCPKCKRNKSRVKTV